MSEFNPETYSFPPLSCGHQIRYLRIGGLSDNQLEQLITANPNQEVIDLAADELGLRDAEQAFRDGDMHGLVN